MARPNPFSNDNSGEAFWKSLSQIRRSVDSFLGNAIKKTAQREVDKIVADKQLESDIDEAVKIIWKYGDIL